MVASFLAIGFTAYGILMWTRPALIVLNHVRELNIIGITMILLSMAALFIFTPVYGAMAGASIRGGTVILENILSYGVFRYMVVRQKRGCGRSKSLCLIHSEVAQLPLISRKPFGVSMQKT